MPCGATSHVRLETTSGNAPNWKYAIPSSWRYCLFSSNLPVNVPVFQLKTSFQLDVYVAPGAPTLTAPQRPADRREMLSQSDLAIHDVQTIADSLYNYACTSYENFQKVQLHLEDAYIQITTKRMGVGLSFRNFRHDANLHQLSKNTHEFMGHELTVIHDVMSKLTLVEQILFPTGQNTPRVPLPALLQFGGIQARPPESFEENGFYVIVKDFNNGLRIAKPGQTGDTFYSRRDGHNGTLAPETDENFDATSEIFTREYQDQQVVQHIEWLNNQFSRDSNFRIQLSDSFGHKCNFLVVQKFFGETVQATREISEGHEINKVITNPSLDLYSTGGSRASALFAENQRQGQGKMCPQMAFVLLKKSSAGLQALANDPHLSKQVYASYDKATQLEILKIGENFNAQKYAEAATFVNNGDSKNLQDPSVLKSLLADPVGRWKNFVATCPYKIEGLNSQTIKKKS